MVLFEREKGLLFMVANQQSEHQFHIPVMGTGFTVGTPVEVARYGISSVISLVDDLLLEQMRRYYSKKENLPFEPISNKEPDARAKRVCAYLNLVHALVKDQSLALQKQPFTQGSDIVRYFELLPESPLKSDYQRMCKERDPDQKQHMQDALRKRAVPGAIDVNIMTKLDRLPYQNGQPLPSECSDALSALRGFATSRLCSSIVFSAGLNVPLYSAIATYPDFLPDHQGRSKKTVILKVSDYRSALIQGRFLAKRGVWVSEFRVESGLNCGGHAFATQGHLLGPILQEFSEKRDVLLQKLHADYNKGLASRSLPTLASPRDMLISVQGGIATHAEHCGLIKHYQVDRTGWATPFLLVPEVTSVDNLHLQRLIDAGEGDVTLGASSPMGIPFWTLQTSESEEQRRRLIAQGRPGSACPKGYLKNDTELSDIPICKASREYQEKKLEAIEASAMDAATKANIRQNVLSKSCICHDLGGGATLKHGLVKGAYTAICPSLSIIHFKATATLEEMVGHIYGRIALFKNKERPHMFICELSLYVDHLRQELERLASGFCDKNLSYYKDFKQNLLKGIGYYQERFSDFVIEHQERFQADLQRLKSQLEDLNMECYS